MGVRRDRRPDPALACYTCFIRPRSGHRQLPQRQFVLARRCECLQL